VAGDAADHVTIAIVRTLPSPAAPCDPDRAYGRASRLPCRLFAAQVQQHSVTARRRAVAGLGNN